MNTTKKTQVPKRRVITQKYPPNTLPKKTIPWGNRPIAGNDRKLYDECCFGLRVRPTDSGG